MQKQIEVAKLPRWGKRYRMMDAKLLDLPKSLTDLGENREGSS